MSTGPRPVDEKPAGTRPSSSADASCFPAPIGLAQQLAIDLAERRDGKIGDKIDRLRHPHRPAPLFDMGLQGRLVAFGAGTQHDEGLDRFPHFGSGMPITAADETAPWESSASSVSRG